MNVFHCFLYFFLLSELPWPLTPTYFGGHFAAKETQKFTRKAIWNKMVTSLSREDVFEEGNFVERSWAGILSFL